MRSFLPKCHNLNKLGSDLLNNATSKYQGSRPSGFRQKMVYVLLIQAYVKHVTPGVGSILGFGA